MYAECPSHAVRRPRRMGRMYVDLEVSGVLDGPYEGLTMELDTGSDDTTLPRALLRRLGIRPLGWDRYELADGRRVRRRYGIAFIRLRGEAAATRTMFGGPRDAPVRALTALEETRALMQAK